jgi:hypothetical protein
MRLLIKLPNAVRKEFEIFVNRARDKEKLSLPIRKKSCESKRHGYGGRKAEGEISEYGSSNTVQSV